MLYELCLMPFPSNLVQTNHGFSHGTVFHRPGGLADGRQLLLAVDAKDGEETLVAAAEDVVADELKRVRNRCRQNDQQRGKFFQPHCLTETRQEMIDARRRSAAFIADVDDDDDDNEVGDDKSEGINKAPVSLIRRILVLLKLLMNAFIC